MWKKYKIEESGVRPVCQHTVYCLLDSNIFVPLSPVRPWEVNHSIRSSSALKSKEDGSCCKKNLDVKELRALAREKKEKHPKIR
jgi:hypothetical protein